ncbi:MAG: hypothetical protein WC149_02905 [Arcobacteraceae bacterium]
MANEHIKFDVTNTDKYLNTIKDMSESRKVDISQVIEAIKYTELKQQSELLIQHNYRASSDLQHSIKNSLNQIEKVLKQMTNTIYNTHSISDAEASIEPYVDEMRQKRFLFLKNLYYKSNASSSKYVKKLEIKKDLKLEDDEANEIIFYLENEGLIHELALSSGEMMISHQGIKEVEDSLTKPSIATLHFPPQINYNTTNNTTIETMNNSQLQQGTTNSTQNGTFTANDKDLLVSFIKELKSELKKLNLNSDVESEINSDIATIETQLSSSRPKKNILKESLLSVKNILEGSMSNIIASQLLEKIPDLSKNLGL